MNYFARTRIIIVGLVLLLATTLSVVTSRQATAQANEDVGQALEIAPPVVNLTADPGQTVTTEIILRDVSDGPLIVTNQINDFTADGEDGIPRLLLEEGEESPYSMRDWFEPISELTLEPRTLTRLPITISVPADAAPGGYFSVIRFTGVAPGVDGNGVGLSASIGALVFMNVNGDANEQMSIEEFFTTTAGKKTSIFQSAPVDFSVRLNNTGNTYEQPTGRITITDMFGQKVGIVNVNLPPRNVLPGSIRKFDQSLDSSVIGNKFLFGLYNAELEVTYGTDQPPIKSSLSFWVIPYTLIGVALAALIIGFLGLRFMIRRYNNHIIKQAQRRGRR